MPDPKPQLFDAPHCLLLALALLVSFTLAGCRDQSGDEKPTTVIVSIPPLVGLVEPLLAEGIELRVLVPAGRSAHGFQPSAADVAAVGRADAIVFVGLGLESAMARTVRTKPVITMASLLGIDEAGHGHHDHDHAHDHDHGSSDPHLWLDPELASEFVRALPSALPAGVLAPDAQERASALAAEIDAVGEAFDARLEPFAGRAIVTHHASFNRPAERYGLRVAAVLRAIETLEPSPADIAAATRAIRDEGVHAIFVEPQFGTTSATRVAEASGVRLVTLDPLGDGDWFAMMRANLDALVDGLGAGASENTSEQGTAP